MAAVKHITLSHEELHFVFVGALIHIFDMLIVIFTEMSLYRETWKSESWHYHVW